MRNSKRSSPSSPSPATQTLPDRSPGAVVLDTDAASRSFKGRLPPALAVRLVGWQPLLTFVTIGELTRWTKLRRRGPGNRAVLSLTRSRQARDTWREEHPVIWGELSAAATLRGRAGPVNDTWVAACCIAYDLPLATLNGRDFSDFADNDGLTLILK